MTWRLVREALSNLRARAGLSLAFAALLMTTILWATLADTAATAKLRDRATDLQRAGFGVLQVTASADSSTPIESVDCEGLGAMPGVEAATWFGPETLATYGVDAAVSLVPVGPAFAELVGAVGPTVTVAAGVFVPAGLVAGSPAGRRWTEQLAFDGREATVQFVAVDIEGLGPVPASSLVYMSAATHDDVTCLLSVDEIDRNLVQRSVANRFPSTGGYSVTWIPPGAERIEVPDAQYRSRPTRQLWILVSVVGAALTALMMRIRRSELGVYRLTGVRGPHTCMVVAIELALVWSVVALATRGMVVGALSRRDVDGLGPVSARQIVLSYLAGLWCSVVVGLASVPSERQVLERLRD